MSCFDCGNNVNFGGNFDSFWSSCANYCGVILIVMMPRGYESNFQEFGELNFVTFAVARIWNEFCGRKCLFCTS